MTGSKTTFALLAAMAVGAPARAQEPPSQHAGVFRPSDAEMTCAQIGDEAATLSAAMGDATPRGGWLSSLTGMARSGATLLVPGGALAVAGVDAVRQPGRERDEAERSEALNRWYYLNGLHAGRGCREPPAPAIQPYALTPPPARAR